MGVEGVVIRTCPLSCGDVLEEGEEVSIVVVSCIVSIGDDIVFSILDGGESLLLLVRGGEGGGVSILMLLFDMVLRP